MSGNRTEFDEDDDLRDPALRRALDHAPDRDATPDARTRDAILKMAHNLAVAPVSATGAAANSARAAPWWRRLFGGSGEPRSRMPWNAAFATLLVAAFVTVLWRSEPVPDARLDGEARVGGAAAPAAEAPAAPVAPVAPVTPEPVPPPVAAQQAPAAPAPAAPAAEQRANVLRDSSSAKETARVQPARKQAAPPPAAPAPVAPSAPPAVVAEPSVPAPAQDERREARVQNERHRAFAPPAPAAPAASVAPPPAIAAAPLSRPSPDASALASQGGANADAASGALRDAAPRAAAKAAPSRVAVPPFGALERWTSLSFTRAGAEMRRERGDIEGLPALVGTVARSATVPDASLDAPVEARLALYRGGALIAVLEIAGDQVRWTPQPGDAALVGTPPAQALDALRSVLTR